MANRDFDELLKQVAAEKAESADVNYLENESALSNDLDIKDDEILQFIRESDVKYKNKNKKKTAMRILQTAAMLVLVFSIGEAVSFSNLDASKEHVFKTIETELGGKISFTTKDEERYVSKELPLEITMDDPYGEVIFRDGEEEMLEGLTGYWYPEEIPEGYVLKDVDSNETGVGLFFENKTNGGYMRICTDMATTNVTFGLDHNQYRLCNVDDNEGMVIYNVLDKSSIIVFESNYQIIEVYVTPMEGVNETIEIVKRLKLVEK